MRLLCPHPREREEIERHLRADLDRAAAPDNPVAGFYGLRKGYRGRFGMYIPPLMEALGLAELTHEKRGNRMRAI